MARQYPRFLFSNPQNTKSKGPFIVHLLPPVMMFKLVEYEPISHLPRKSYGLERLDWGEPASDESIRLIKNEAWNWIAPQLKDLGFTTIK